MKRAADFRESAREALRGNWVIAVLTGFVASLLGATTSISAGGNFSFDGDLSEDSANTVVSDETVETLTVILPILFIILIVLLLWGLVTAVISGACKLGYAKFNLNLIDGHPAAFSDLFSQFDRFASGFCMNLLIGIYVALWSMLFIIPGIVKAYSYAMTPYILAEHPEMSANEAITESKRIMQGNKWRLVCLEFSFIGWSLLGLAAAIVVIPLIFMGPFGVLIWAAVSILFALAVSLFLCPYQEAARAAFYRDVSRYEQPSYTQSSYVNY